MTPAASTDPVVAALTDLARASFPQILDEHLDVPLFQTGMYLRPDRAHANSGAPLVPKLREAAYAAIAADPVLKVLADAPTSHELGVFVQDSSGMGWRLQPAEVVPVLQRLAADHVLAKNSPVDVVGPLVQETEDLVTRLRELLAGQKSFALTRIAYEGIDLQEGVRLELPWGVLRRATASERKMVAFGFKGPTVVLEHWFPIGLVVYEPPRADEPAAQPELPTGPDPFDPDLLSFAIALAVGSGWPVPPRVVWESELKLLHPRRGFQGNFRGREYPYGPESPTIEAGQEEQLVLWAGRVADHYQDSVAVAVSRLLSSARERSFSVEDSLIDAVIAWENLFGHGGNTEMVFRVTGAMAILLEADPAKRVDLQRRLKKIYDLRSRVAHGGTTSEKDSIGELRADAERFALEALRTLFSSRVSLLQHVDRGMRLQLGIPDDLDLT